ncbi:D-glycero-alpha-D-manno-heptose-1,7-bisphosphate 7-phosphatase [Actinophytocola glycyrrhizae]|uniref:D,D-heptose 1,7-bisphosphate phosphatase n=1 Tax=Actinophytocola glycyrrhizae TaxID=2044873 RepID=A0ABV9RTW9_9PSEU
MLFDRDGTLVEDVPYNGDPDLVVLRPGARAAVDLLRANGIRLGIVSNQSGVARGLLTTRQVHRVHARVTELLGPFDDIRFCPHGPEDGCACRKPAPGMVRAACTALGVRPSSVVVIGDIGADVGAATAAGATPILVPTPVTRRDEVDRAPLVAADLPAAARLAAGLLTGVPA